MTLAVLDESGVSLNGELMRESIMRSAGLLVLVACHTANIFWFGTWPTSYPKSYPKSLGGAHKAVGHLKIRPTMGPPGGAWGAKNIAAIWPLLLAHADLAS